jgi:PST family polysaccharide transporter
VAVLLGPQWSGVAPVILALAPAGAIQSVTFNSAQILFAKGRADWAFRWGLLHLGLLTPLELVGARWGITGVAWGYAIGVILIAPFTLLLTFRTIDLRMRDYLAPLVPFAVSSLAMVAVVVPIRVALADSGASDLVQLGGSVGAGVVVYAFAMWRWRPQGVVDAVTALRGRAA